MLCATRRTTCTGLAAGLLAVVLLAPSCGSGLEMQLWKLR
jgi:hypothetical protein